MRTTLQAEKACYFTSSLDDPRRSLHITGKSEFVDIQIDSIGNTDEVAVLVGNEDHCYLFNLRELLAALSGFKAEMDMQEARFNARIKR